jgi:Tfp pilus assembly protein PilX
MKMFSFNKKYLNAFKWTLCERGIALPVTLMMLVALGALALVATQWSSQDIARTDEYYETREAFYIAEAGIQKAINLLNYTDSTGGDESSPGVEISAGGFDDVLTSFVSNNASDLTNVSFGSGTYSVTVADNDDGDGDTTDDDDNNLILTSIGTSGDRSVTLEAVIVRRIFKGDNAITTEGDLGGNGSFTIDGTNGSIHSNNSVTVSGGSATITEGATASGTCSGTGCVAGGVAPEDIPIINPSDYQSFADYHLHDDGTIEEVSSGDIYTFSNSGGGHWTHSTTGDGDANFEGLSYSNSQDRWSAGSSNIANGFFYVETDFKTTGCPPGWETTIVAEGYIDFGGNSDVVNYKDAGDTEDIQNLFLVAGTDIEFSGNPSNTIQGFFAAGEQISVSGSVTLEGSIVASDASNSENLVTGNTIGGSLTITYNGDLIAPFLGNKVKIIAWQEI